MRKRVLRGFGGGLVGAVLVAARAGALCESGPLPAACETVYFEVGVSSVADPNGILGPVGASITGTMTLDTSTPDSDPSPTYGTYFRAVECATIDFGQAFLEATATSIDLAPPNGVFLKNDEPTAQPTVQVDEYQAGIDETGAARLDAQSAVVGFDLVMATACAAPVFPCPPTALGSDAIPIPPPAPAAFALGASAFRLGVGTVAGFADVQGTPTALTSGPPIACPEPGLAPALAVAGPALFALARRRGRGRRAVRRS